MEACERPVGEVSLVRLLLFGWVLCSSGCGGLTTSEVRREGSEGRSASSWVVATYPLWGLPRDLVDIPLTAINRTGFGTFTARGSKTFLKGSFISGVLVGGYVGITTWIEAGYWEALVAQWAPFAAVTGGLIGADLLYGFVVNPLQVALLRTGVDDHYWKIGDHQEGEGEEAIDTEGRERSRSFFPNWNYLVHGWSMDVGSSAIP